MNGVRGIPDRPVVDPAAANGTTDDAAQVAKLAAEFESMLLAQVLRHMRESGRWDEDEVDGGLGGDTFFETLDVELAGYLARARGLGLASQLQQALGQAVQPASVARGTDVGHAEVAAVVQPSAGPIGQARAVEPGLRYAVAAGSITSPYGWRRDPINGEARFHRGIDIRAAYGQDIHAAGEGRVVFSGEQRGYGTTVIVEHENGVRTRYAHLSATVVQEGDRVAAGQTIGRAGHSGRATGTHLHFEVTKGNKPVSPAEAGLIVQSEG